MIRCDRSPRGFPGDLYRAETEWLSTSAPLCANAWEARELAWRAPIDAVLFSCYRATRGTSIEAWRPIRELGQQAEAVDGPYTRFDGTIVYGTNCLRLVQVVVLVFGCETVICLDISQLSAAK